MDPGYLPFHPNPRKPVFTPPPGAVADIRDVFVQTGISVVDQSPVTEYPFNQFSQ
jgi:hypothetical protein